LLKVALDTIKQTNNLHHDFNDLIDHRYKTIPRN
jgi:hypothetical protein